MTRPSQIKVLIWKVSSEYVLSHPNHNPHGLNFSSGPTAGHVYAHTRQIDWSAMHKDVRDAQPANDPSII